MGIRNQACIFPKWRWLDARAANTVYDINLIDVSLQVLGFWIPEMSSDGNDTQAHMTPTARNF